jgi:DNA ligase-associated metallophosphoesterase
MADVTVSIPEFGFTLRLLPERAALIEETQTLLIADPHFGKSATFRKGGIPIPDSVLQDDLARLSGVLKRTEANELLILGDFFHSDVNAEWDTFLGWKAIHHKTEMLVVPGNHDKAMLTFLQAENLLATHEVQRGSLTLRHEPPEDLSKPSICGHIHPALTLRGKARQSLRLPAFVLVENTLVLPSFGSFTGFEDLSKSRYTMGWVVKGDNVWSTK